MSLFNSGAVVKCLFLMFLLGLCFTSQCDAFVPPSGFPSTLVFGDVNGQYVAGWTSTDNDPGIYSAWIGSHSLFLMQQSVGSTLFDVYVDGYSQFYSLDSSSPTFCSTLIIDLASNGVLGSGAAMVTPRPLSTLPGFMDCGQAVVLSFWGIVMGHGLWCLFIGLLWFCFHSMVRMFRAAKG